MNLTNYDIGTVIVGLPRRPMGYYLARDWQERAIYEAIKAGLQIVRANRDSYSIEDNRNELAKVALGWNAKWLWMCDDDVLPPPTAILHMLHRAHEVKADVLAALCTSKDGRPVFFDKHTGMIPDEWGIPAPRFRVAWDFVTGFLAGREVSPPWSDGSIPTDEATLRCVAVGAGCILINVDVFRNLPGPWFIRWAGQIPGTNVYASGVGGEDVGFCHYAGQNGHTIYGDASIFCVHERREMIGVEALWEAHKRDVTEKQQKESDECLAKQDGRLASILERARQLQASRTPMPTSPT
jgi:hypothetical protein